MNPRTLPAEVPSPGKESASMSPPRSAPSRPRAGELLRRKKGVALLMVLFVMVALTSIVVSLTDTTQRHLHLTAYYKNHLQAFWTAQSGIQAGVALLQLDHQLQPNWDAFDSVWNCESTEYQENALAFLSIPLCGSSLIEPAVMLAQQGGPALGEPAARTRCPIVDENRKLSLFPLLKNLYQQSEATTEDVFDRLTYLLMYLLSEQDLALPGEPGDESDGLTPLNSQRREPLSYARASTLAGYLVDWIDSANNTSATELNPDQAEESCPEDGLPYTAKNGMMDSVDELALVCGFRQIPRHVIDELARNLTIYDLETNINTATQPVLHAFCSQILRAEEQGDSEAIYEALHPFEDELPDSAITDKSAYSSILGGLVSDAKLISGLQSSTGVQSDFFQIGIRGVVINTSTGSVDATASVTMVVRRGGGTRSRPGQEVAGGALQLFYYREG